MSPPMVVRICALAAFLTPIALMSCNAGLDPGGDEESVLEDELGRGFCKRHQCPDAGTPPADGGTSTPDAGVPPASPAALSVTAFTAPATVLRGTTFSIALTVSNTGQTAANQVLPNPLQPTATATGLVKVTVTSTPTAVSIPAKSSHTFSWTVSEMGTGVGTVSFSAGVSGVDASSGAVLTVGPVTSAVATVTTAPSCNGSLAYVGLGSRSLEADRVDNPVGTDRRQVKPYSMLPSEYARVLGSTPTTILNQGKTFNEPVARWHEPAELAAVSLYQAFQAAFEGCLTFTATAAKFAVNPTSTTAPTECAAFQQAFWSRVPTSAETSACASFATSAVNNDVDPRRRWAYACAAVLTSTGFLTY